MVKSLAKDTSEALGKALAGMLLKLQSANLTHAKYFSNRVYPNMK